MNKQMNNQSNISLYKNTQYQLKGKISNNLDDMYKSPEGKGTEY